MKLILAAIGATALVAAIMLHHRPDPTTVDSSAIRVVTGREPAVALVAPSAPAYATPPVALQTAPGAAPSSATADPDAASLNTARSDEPFASQHRNPEWAGHIESLVGGQLPRGGAITCAAYMCKATVPLPSTDLAANAANIGDDIQAADQRAVLATQNWPSEIAYNPQTAQIVRGPGGSSLTFLVTRTQWPAAE